MDYSSPSNGAVIAANSGKSPTVALFPRHNQINIDSTPHLAVISKAFRQLQQQQPQRTHIINNRNTMNSNFSDVLRSNKPPGISAMINSTSPLDILANAGGGSGVSGNGFSGRFAAMNNSAIIANMTAAATSLRRPLKRTKLEGNQDPGDGNHAFPPSVVLIPHHPPQQLLQEQQQLAGYSSEDSIGDDTESRESVDRSNSPASNHHQQQQDGARSGVRFREYQAEIWSEKFEELCLFRRENGHCHVPHHYQENQGLAQWVKRQRYQYKLKLEGKRSTLSDERVRHLNTIGFIWNSHDAVFHERLQDLILFKQIHGHCVVPSNYEPNVQLAVWTKRQRRQYKKYQEGSPSSMTPERITKLETIGFVWDCRKLNSNLKDTKLEDEHRNASADSDGTISAAQAKKSASSSVHNTSLAAQQQQLPMLRHHHPKSEFITTTSTTTNKVQQQRGTGYDDNPTEANAKTTTMHILPEADLAASQKLQEVKIDRPPLRMPKCEFFSFSRKFQY